MSGYPMRCAGGTDVAMVGAGTSARMVHSDGTVCTHAETAGWLEVLASRKRQTVGDMRAIMTPILNDLVREVVVQYTGWLAADGRLNTARPNELAVRFLREEIDGESNAAALDYGGPDGGGIPSGAAPGTSALPPVSAGGSPMKPLEVGGTTSFLDALASSGPFRAGEVIPGWLTRSTVMKDARDEVLDMRAHDLRSCSTRALVRELVQRGEARRLADQVGGVALYEWATQMYETLPTEVLDTVYAPVEWAHGMDTEAHDQ